jgi:hypothetical protein
MLGAEFLLAIFLIFLLGGLVKGIAGIGLPTVAIALMAIFIGLKEGIALMVVPTLASNIWQALAGGRLAEILRGIVPDGDVSLVLVADGFDARWRADGPTGEVLPFPAFGWGLGFEGRPGPITVRFEGGARRSLELVGLGLLWAVALWSVRRREERPGRAAPPVEVSAPVREATPA